MQPKFFIKKTASIAHVISENWHETASKDATKSHQESSLISITQVNYSKEFLVVFFLAPLGAFRVSVFEIQAINSSEFFDKEFRLRST